MSGMKNREKLFAQCMKYGNEKKRNNCDNSWKKSLRNFLIIYGMFLFFSLALPMSLGGDSVSKWSELHIPSLYTHLGFTSAM